MLQPSWDSASKGTLSSSPIIKEQRPTRPLCELGVCATTLSSNMLVFAEQMSTATLWHVFLPLVQTVCTVVPMEHAPSFYHYPNQIAVPLVLASPKTHIDILLDDAPVIMGFRIERDTVKFANYKAAATITTALWDRWLRHIAVF
ncbi:hypothetical protein MRX96_034040 [Rhipicephalus microplus]